jgi:exoribonuclease R
MRVPGDGGAFAAGLRRIRDQFDVPDGFPPDVLAAAEQASARRPGAEHVDRTDIDFVTLDPAGSTDLDQAFAVERDGTDLVLRYAIADVGWFVTPGDPLDTEAWARGVTVYVPGEKAPLYPPSLSEAAASLLPDGPRPAVIFVVRVAEDGAAQLAGAERAVIRSRAQLAYDSVRAEELPADFAELSMRMERAELARDAPRVDFPEQDIVVGDDGRWRLVIEPRLETEDHNAGMSLATNLAVADALHAAHTGLFRVMPEPTERALGRLRHTARAFGLDWPRQLNLTQFQRTLPLGDPRTHAFLIAVRRASGGASYEPYVDGVRPWHAAMAATYAHATAPLRRLADRYVVEAALAVANGDTVADDVQEAWARLPAAMRQGEERANRVDAAVFDLAEAVVMAGCVGETFAGVVVDEDDRGALVQLTDPAVLARVTARKVDPGDDVRVEVVAVDVEQRTVELRRVA